MMKCEICKDDGWVITTHDENHFKLCRSCTTAYWKDTPIAVMVCACGQRYSFITKDGDTNYPDDCGMCA